MIRKSPAVLPMVVAFLLLLSAAPVTYSQQQESSAPDNGQGSTTADKITLCVPADLVDRDGFEHPAPGSKMDAFHAALRNFLRDHGDVRLEYLVRRNAFEIFDPANADPSDLMDEASAVANCRETDYSYTLPVKRAGENAAQGTSQSVAQQSSARDSLYRGWQYQVGQGVPKDVAMAARLYADAAREGIPDGMYRLALMYRDGNGVSRDPAGAVSWFYQAAKQGHAAAQMELGFALITGNGARRDDVAAFRWLQLAAQAGLPQAQGTLGAMYETGQGVTQNEPEAALWFRRAAEQGLIAGMYELGQSLRLGRGVERNEREAVQWYLKSANAGYVLAQAELGFCYMTGLGTAQDYPQAAHWLSEAARQGDPYAQLNLAALYVDGTGVDRNLAQARALYAQAANGPEPKVAERARQLAATLPDSPGEVLPGHSTDSSNTTAVIGVAATVIVGAMLLSFLSGSNSSDSTVGPPSANSPWQGWDTSSSDRRPTPPPTPHCHEAPIEDPFTITPGVFTPHGGTTMVCD